MNSCQSCKWFNQQTEDHGFCEYPIPASLILALGEINPGRDLAMMPSRYAPCMCWQIKTPETGEKK